MFKRKYLNRIEENYFLMTACLMLFINGQSEGCNDKGMLKEYEDNKMFSSSTHKNFKLGMTYIKKFLQETFDNLDKPTQDRIKKKTNKFLIKFINQYEYNKFQREINDKNKYAVLEREEFEEIIEDIAEVRCVNCTKEYCDCNIYPVLDYSLKLEGNGTEKNCKYAWRR